MGHALLMCLVPGGMLSPLHPADVCGFGRSECIGVPQLP